MTQLHIDLSYDGGAFHGWTSQPGLRTVQGVLGGSLDRVLRLDPASALTITGCTDTGIHTHGQVCYIDVEDPALSLADLLHRLRRICLGGIVIHDVTEAPSGFDARLSAIWRRCYYHLVDSAQVPNPLSRNHVIRLRYPLHLGTTQEATRLLTGLRDFTPFCEAREGTTIIHSLREFTVTRQGDGVVEVYLLANAFCHSVVRALVGALTVVSAERRSLAWLEGVTNSDHYCGEVPLVPAHGLVLEEVDYPADEQLASRACGARTHQSLERT